MNMLPAIRLSLKEISSHKLRSFLTMLGVVFGVMAVISMVSITEGAKEETIEQFRESGINIISFIRKPINPSGNDKNKPNYTSSLIVADTFAIEKTLANEIERITAVRKVNAEIIIPGKPPKVNVYGVMPDYFDIKRYRLKDGRTFDNEDLAGYHKVCLLCQPVAEEIFGPENPIGKRIKLNNNYYVIIGILNEKKGSSSSDISKISSENKNIFIPLTSSTADFYLFSDKPGLSELEKTIMERFIKKHYNDYVVSEIIMEVRSDKKIMNTADIAKKILIERHKNYDDFDVEIPLEKLIQIENQKKIFNLILSAIAGISLIVGGIGIMNIMLATVTQRTKEIGIRRCIGATRKDIIIQFLIECIVITFIGGFIGIISGIITAKVISAIGNWKTVVSFNAVFISFTISILVGLVFGLWPAYRAAEISPIEALRYE